LLKTVQTTNGDTVAQVAHVALANCCPSNVAVRDFLLFFTFRLKHAEEKSNSFMKRSELRPWDRATSVQGCRNRF